MRAKANKEGGRARRRAQMLGGGMVCSIGCQPRAIACLHHPSARLPACLPTQSQMGAGSGGRLDRIWPPPRVRGLEQRAEKGVRTQRRKRAIARTPSKRVESAGSPAWLPTGILLKVARSSCLVCICHCGGTGGRGRAGLLSWDLE